MARRSIQTLTGIWAGGFHRIMPTAMCVVISVNLVSLTTRCLAADSPPTVVLEKLWDRDRDRAAKLDDYVRQYADVFRTPDAAYALALVRIKQGENAAAEAFLDRMIAASPHYYPFQKLRTTLYLARRQKAEALESCLTLARELASRGEVAESGGKPTADTVTRPAESEFETLGTFVGIVEGPLGGSTVAEKLAEVTAAVEENASLEELTAFSKARQAVLDRHAELMTERTASVEERNATAKADLEQIVSGYQSEISTLAKRKSEIDLEVMKLQKDLEGDTKQKQERVAVIQQQLGPAQTQIVLIETQIGQLSDEIRRFSNALAINQNNPLLVATTGQQIDAIRFRQLGLRQEIVAVQNRVAPLTREMVQLTGEAQQASAQAGQAAGKLRREASDIDRKINDLRRKSDRAQGKSSPMTAGPLDGPRPDNASTYYDYPMDVERDRLLAVFAEK